MNGKLQIRSDIIAFLDVDGTFVRMQGFTSFSTKKNPREYSRQYVDETHEQTDVTGYSPSVDFAFDRYVGNAAHDRIAEIIDNEYIGTDAVVNILITDKNAESPNAYTREFALIADKEGDSFDAYTYSGTFAVKGAKVWGDAVVAADGLTAVFTAEADFDSETDE